MGKKCFMNTISFFVSTKKSFFSLNCFETFLEKICNFYPKFVCNIRRQKKTFFAKQKTFSKTFIIPNILSLLKKYIMNFGRIFFVFILYTFVAFREIYLLL